MCREQPSVRESISYARIISCYSSQRIGRGCAHCRMGWLRLVGSLKLQVSFAEQPYKQDYSAKETYNIKEPTHRSHSI